MNSEWFRHAGKGRTNDTWHNGEPPRWINWHELSGLFSFQTIQSSEIFALCGSIEVFDFVQHFLDKEKQFILKVFLLVSKPSRRTRIDNCHDHHRIWHNSKWIKTQSILISSYSNWGSMSHVVIKVSPPRFKENWIFRSQDTFSKPEKPPQNPTLKGSALQNLQNQQINKPSIYRFASKMFYKNIYLPNKTKTELKWRSQIIRVFNHLVIYIYIYIYMNFESPIVWRSKFWRNEKTIPKWRLKKSGKIKNHLKQTQRFQASL